MLLPESERFLFTDEIKAFILEKREIARLERRQEMLVLKKKESVFLKSEEPLSKTSKANNQKSNNLSHLTSYIRRHLDEEGIVKIGSYVKEHDILVGKLTPCEEDTSP